MERTADFSGDCADDRIVAYDGKDRPDRMSQKGDIYTENVVDQCIKDLKTHQCVLIGSRKTGKTGRWFHGSDGAGESKGICLCQIIAVINIRMLEQNNVTDLLANHYKEEQKQ